MSMTLNFRQLDRKWQQVWEQQATFRAANPGEPGSDRPPFYVLDFFPYPSGAGLHVGHPLGYIASDIIARYMRMKGFNVLHPMGWDAFGLPAEQYAIETGVHPAVTTRKNIATYTQQLKMIGLSFDWSREIATCDPDYYRWTQWVFLQLFDSWYDPNCRWTDDAGRSVVGRARPMAELPVPSDVQRKGAAAIEAFRGEHRLAFLSEVPVNWCPALGTVLANEEVTADGRSERGNHPVFKRPLKQWMLRITRYAERLLSDLDPLDWPEPIKLMQRNWIGRSEGAFVNFPLADLPGESLRIYTTRPDTLYGATYMVLAPEHPLVARITSPAQRRAVDEYVAAASKKSEVDRTAEGKTKTGVFTGGFAINPVNAARIPVWIADYVLAGYGTGAIMAVPGSDKRDCEFAEKFHLPIVQVVQPPTGTEWLGFEDDGTAVNSPPPAAPAGADACTLNGLSTPAAKRKIIDWLESHDLGRGAVQYKLRDWLFSRQRYWGEPFPLLHRADGTIVPVATDQLPVALPEVADFKPTASNDPNAQPQTPLSRAGDWMKVRVGDTTMTREANTMPQWAGSCWYYLRFCDAQNQRTAISPAAEKYWASTGAQPHGKAVLPSVAAAPKAPEKIGFVDLYVGGAEHAVLHLLYARFWHKVLYDRGIVSTPEPFQRLFNQGMITAVAYHDAREVYIERQDVEIQNHNPLDAVHRVTREKLSARVEKMSKSKKNVVNPDEICEQYGADTLRLYEMFLGPIDAGKPWSTEGINGVHRFLQRAWRLVAVEEDPNVVDDNDAAQSKIENRKSRISLNPRIGETRDPALERLLHKAIAKVTLDIDRFAFNTAISEMMVWSTEAAKAIALHRDQVERFVLLLAPFAPHLAEELWQQLGHDGSLAREPWPTFDPALTRDDMVELAVQINGKLRGRMQVAADADDATIIAAARSLEAIQKELAGRPTKREIVVKGRLVNLIV